MAKIDSLLVLVNSMNKAEKRLFQLTMRGYEKEKDYQFLYQLLQQKQAEPEKVRNQFNTQRPRANFDICCHHLYKQLMRSLIEQETEKDIENHLLKQYRECKILFQRALYDDCFKLIEQASAVSLQYEKYQLHTLFSRLELQSLNQLEFKGCSENELIRKQGKLETASRNQRAIDNHYALYNLIRHRQYCQGPTRNNEEKGKLNDLAFNELQANFGQTKDSFESQKIHLLFQSSYFLMTANPRSSLKTYFELNELFEQNPTHRAASSDHYLSHIQGILHNLRIFEQYNEMPYFIEKAKNIASEFPGTSVRALFLAWLYESFLLTDRHLYYEAFEQTEKSTESIVVFQSNLSLSSLSELQLQLALVFYKNKKYRQASRELNRILQHGKILQQQAVYPTLRLLMVMIRFDSGDRELLAYEIRSLEREFAQSHSSRQTERSMLKLIRQTSSTTEEKREKIIQKQIQFLEVLAQNSNEKLRIQALDLLGWLNSLKKQRL